MSGDEMGGGRSSESFDMGRIYWNARGRKIRDIDKETWYANIFACC